jgi:hypothetical protein
MNIGHILVQGMRDLRRTLVTFTIKSTASWTAVILANRDSSKASKWPSLCVSAAQETQDVALRTVSNRMGEEYIYLMEIREGFSLISKYEIISLFKQ